MSLSIATSALAALGQGALNTIFGKGRQILGKQRADSLVSLTQVARIEPVTMIDEQLRMAPYLEDVLHSMVSLFAGYYLQAVALTSSINSINVLNRLDSLNPNRSAGFRITGLESHKEMLDERFYTFGLPRAGAAYGLEAYGGHSRATAIAALEAISEKESLGQTMDKVLTTDNIAGVATLGDPGTSVGAPALAEGAAGDANHTISDRTIQDIVQSAPLSVGKLLNVTVTEDGKSLQVPVSIRLLATTVKPMVLTHILSDGSRNATWKDRWHGWRSGELGLWRDIIFATDIVDEHRKALLADNTGAYQEILARRRGNHRAALFSATPSLATASNLMVISRDTALAVERRGRGQMKDAKFRAKIFGMSYLMILAIVDTDNQMVTFYHRGVAMGTTVSVRELKASARGNGPDIAEILAKLLAGQSPSLH